ncbi:MAG: hypothetical protein QM831_14255 [Kofleriaceae bacterium]
MSKDTLPKVESKSVVGVVPGAAHLALDVADRSQSTAIAVLQDARVEIKAVFDHGIELAEKTTAAFFRFAKKLGQRIDEGVADTLGKTERLLTGAVDSARNTTHAATDLAHSATAGLAGKQAQA